MKRKKQGKETSGQMTTKRNAEDIGTFGESEKEKTPRNYKRNDKHKDWRHRRRNRLIREQEEALGD